MQTDLRRIRNRFTMMVVCSFILTPFAGLWAAILFGSATWPAIRDVAAQGVLPLFLIGMTLWVAFHFWRFLNPVLAWLEQHPASETGPAHLCRRLARFPRDYWGLFACYVLAVPVIYFWSSGVPLRHGDYGALSNFLILQLSVATLIGLPAYLSAQDRLGKLAAYLGLERVQFSLKSRLMLLGGFVPLLSYSILTHYYWLRTGYISSQTWIVWGTLALITVAVTLLSIHSLAGALRPVQEVLGRSGAATHEELAELRPQSTDEIGYLTQTLGKLFRRLRDQESHMHAIVDTAAEGIIVADSGGLIDTFNAAAERLFGYNAQEIRGRPLAWLLPTLVADGGAPNPARGEQEVEGVHRSGRRIPMSVRASEMSISGKRMFTLLVGDISERKAAEQKLTNAELRYRELVETAHDLVWSLDPQWRWTYLNSAATTIYGYPPEEMLSRSFTDFEAPEYAQQATTAFASLLQGNELVQYETVHLDREGNPHYLSFNARVHTDERGNVIRISGTARDITEQKAFERRLAYQAEHDSLTGLYNRNYFQHELERVVARIARSGAECALLYIDIDQFKYINDTLGHAAGDRLLIEISNLLDTHVREGDLLARFGGDEFTVLLYNIEPDRVPQVAENFRLLFERFKFLSAGNSFNITCSIGVSNIDNTVHSAEEVLSHADLACNIAKAHGRNRVNLYNPADRDKVGMAEDMGWAARVREMLEQDRFLLVYQPIVSIADGSVHEYEVLMRMVLDDGQIILPGGFMPAAERFGLIHSVDRWIIKHAIARLAEIREIDRTVRFSINLSGRAFEDPTLLPLIRDLLNASGLDPALLTFEITETAAIANLSAAIKFIHALKDIGCQFALDDFGSGFCSFTYLKHLPVDKLKIDGSFVQNLAHAPVDQAMVKSMNQVTHVLGKVTIAEYVESAQALKLLRDYGVDFAQGNFLGRPSEVIPVQINLPKAIYRQS